MKLIPNNELVIGEIYMIAATTGEYRGLVDRLVRVVAIDLPFCVLHVFMYKSDTTCRLDEFTFLAPSKEFLKWHYLMRFGQTLLTCSKENQLYSDESS